MLLLRSTQFFHYILLFILGMNYVTIETFFVKINKQVTNFHDANQERSW